MPHFFHIICYTDEYRNLIWGVVNGSQTSAGPVRRFGWMKVLLHVLDKIAVEGYIVWL